MSKGQSKNRNDLMGGVGHLKKDKTKKDSKWGKKLENLSEPLQAIGLVLLLTSGAYFLPEWLPDTFFPFLPEEFRALALGASLCCISSCCLSLVLVVILSLN